MLVSLIGLRIPPKVIVVLVIVILFTPSSSVVLGLLSHTGDSLYEKETPYSHLDVTDTKQFRTLYLNGLRHSQMDKDDPNALTLQYTKYFHFGTVFNPDIEKVLFVGGGGFSGPKSFLSIYPEVLVDVVEIDPDVIDVAKKYFEVQENPRLRIFNDDGRNFLLNNDEKYDLIILDAYANDYVPYHLLTVEYFQLLNNKLNPDGIIISNIVGSLVGDTSNSLRAGYKTMDYVFPTPYVFTTLENNIGSVQNIIFVITKTETQYDKNYLLKSIEGNSILNIDDLNNFYEKGINVEDVPLLTDEFAPVENLLNPITSRSFMPSGPQHTGVESEIGWSESTAVTIGLLLAIVMFWPFHLKLIWKKQ